MKKVILSLGSLSREANANEYPLRSEPKSAPGKAQANGVEVRTRFTSGKGKSAINNHYLYWVEGETMFYTRVTAEELAKAKTEAVVIADAKEPQAAVPSPVASGDVTPLPSASPEPAKPRRQRAKA